MLKRIRLAFTRRFARFVSQVALPEIPAYDPPLAQTLRKKGSALIAEEKFKEAEECFRAALLHHADDVQSLICLGYVLKEQGHFAEARAALRRAATSGHADPDAYEAHYLLSEISELEGDRDDAIRCLSKTLDLKHDFTRACTDLIRLLHLQGRRSEVRKLLLQSVKLVPESAEYRLLLGKACADEMDFQMALDNFKEVVRLGTDNAEVNLCIGAALCRLDRLSESLNFFNRSEMLDPITAFEVRFHLGNANFRIGNSKEAIMFLQQSIKLQPNFLPAYSQLLFALNFAETEVRRSYQDVATQFGKLTKSQPLAIQPKAPPSADREKRVLRIGFLSGEFRNHPVYFFIIGILEHIDRSKFQLIAYSNNEADDHVTPSIKAKMDAWNVIRELSDDAAALLIHSHQIDVLIDLCGHSGEGRLQVFARRPALVQVSWLGYFASTGLNEMDYLIADPISVPEDSTEWFSETVLRLPTTRLCMRKPQPSRDIALVPPPCLTKGYVTFGSFQQEAKITPAVLQVWSMVMARVPTSRLRIQSSSLDSPAAFERFSARMRSAEIDPSRVDLLGSMAWEDYLEAHGEVDMLIDTFPYSGGTTTAFALWMGVPIVTLLGDTILSRQGAAMLSCVGLSDWIANEVADYVSKAVMFSQDVQSLVQLRAGLRETVEKSPLFDTETFVHHFQDALTNMYQARLSELQT